MPNGDDWQITNTKVFKATWCIAHRIPGTVLRLLCTLPRFLSITPFSQMLWRLLRC